MFMMVAGYKKCTLLVGTQSAPQGMRVMPTARSTSASEGGHSPQVSDAGHVCDYVVLARLALVLNELRELRGRGAHEMPSRRNVHDG